MNSFDDFKKYCDSSEYFDSQKQEIYFFCAKGYIEKKGEFQLTDIINGVMKIMADEDYETAIEKKQLKLKKVADENVIIIIESISKM